jgi:hypothetical protein
MTYQNSQLSQVFSTLEVASIALSGLCWVKGCIKIINYLLKADHFFRVGALIFIGA